MWAQTVGGILTAAAIIGALFVIGRGAVRAFDVFRKFARFVDDLTGEPPRPGFPEGRPGLLDRLDRIEQGQADQSERLTRVEQLLDAEELRHRSVLIDGEPEAVKQ